MIRPLVLIPALLLAACGGSEPAAPEGEACAALAADAFAARGIELRHDARINDVTVQRQFGTSSCSATTAGRSGRGAACELSSPGVIHVTAEGADHYFDIPVGVPATVTVSGGEVRCVLKQERTR